MKDVYIDEHQARILVAEHLMGFKWIDIENGQRALVLSKQQAKDIQLAESLYKFVPHYSRDFEAMWEVEERIRVMCLHDIYLKHLTRDGDTTFDCVHASLGRRCIAAARTICEHKKINLS